MKLSILIPAFNEARTLDECVRRVVASPYPKEVIVVDDGSTDGTPLLLERLATRFPGQVRAFYHRENRGKGAALRTAIERAEGDVIIIQDADLEYDPEDYPRLVGPIERGRADAVYGSRFLPQERRVLYFRHALGNRFVTAVSNLLTDLNLSDMETCYKAFRRQVLQNLVLESDRFGFEPEITAKLAKSPCVLYEVPISYHGRTYAQGKKITWRDGLAALWHIVRFNLFRRQGRCFRRPWSEIEGLVGGPLEPEGAAVIPTAQHGGAGDG